MDFIEAGQMTSRAPYGHSLRGSGKRVTFSKSVPVPVFAMGPAIDQISLSYDTLRNGERSCRINHYGANQSSGTNVLVSDFTDHFKAQGWVVTEPKTLRKGRERIGFHGNARRSPYQASEIAFFRSPS